MQGCVGKHDVVAQALGVEVFPALQCYSLSAFLGLRGLACRVAGHVGMDVGAELVALDFHHQVFAVGAAQHEVGRVGVPAAIVAQVLGAQVGFARVGQAAGEPQAFDLVRVALQQAQRPIQKFGLGRGVEVVALVVEAGLQGQRGMGRVLGLLLEWFALFRKADAGGVDALAIHLGMVEALGLDQGHGHFDFVPGFLVLAALGFDLQRQGIEVMLWYL